MATTKVILDTRGIKKGNTCPLKIVVYHRHRQAFIHFNFRLLPVQWDAVAERVINHPQKAFLNNLISQRKTAIDFILYQLPPSALEKLTTATALRDKLVALYEGENHEETKAEDLFAARFRAYADQAKKESTKSIYMQTYRRMLAFDKNLESLTFEEITKEWLTNFERFMALTSPSQNARNIHLRNIRTVFNDAIDDEITTSYPFRKIKIKPVPTAKRALTVEQLRTIFTYPVEEYAERHRDIFKLIFYLIGINIIDLYNLRGLTPDGRAEYNRSKTGRLYSIKVEPEAMEIIDRYRGVKRLLNMADTYKNYKDYAAKLNMALQAIGPTKIGKRGKKTLSPLFPHITTYWARHTWATIAASLDIPKETIAAALGHGGNTVTDIYIDFDRRKIDAANRKVIDYVLGGI